MMMTPHSTTRCYEITLALKNDNHKHKVFKQSNDLVNLLLWTNQMGNHKLLSLKKADTQKDTFSLMFIYAHTPMNVNLLVYICATFI